MERKKRTYLFKEGTTKKVFSWDRDRKGSERKRDHPLEGKQKIWDLRKQRKRGGALRNLKM